MRIRKAVITAAGRNQRALPLQTLIDRDGMEKTVLRILIEEVTAASIEEICLVIAPGDEQYYADAAGDRSGSVRFVVQAEPAGYGDALFHARHFTGDDPFLHLVGDHLYVGDKRGDAARQLIEIASVEKCALSAVQLTRESLLRYYGSVGGERVAGRSDLYRIHTVIEKPTPTRAEQELSIPGIRSAYYLCFFGMHVLTPRVMSVLERQLAAAAGPVTLSSALAEVARHELFMAVESTARRYNLGVRYGLFKTQLALALRGCDRDEVLTQMVDLLAQPAAARDPGC